MGDYILTKIVYLVRYIDKFINEISRYNNKIVDFKKAAFYFLVVESLNTTPFKLRLQHN